jgi:hypothetical protein
MGALSMFDAYKGNNGGIDFDASHRVIGALVDILQNNFREDTNYKRPLMPPQANILFALDKEVAEQMIAYMSEKMKDIGQFKESDFKFTRKSNHDVSGLHRVRLEFVNGVTTEIINKVIVMTDTMAKKLSGKQSN